MNKDLLAYEDALQRLLDAAQPLTESETVTTLDAMGRVLASDVVSAIDVPPLDNSAMDGYALRCADAPAIGTRLPVSQRVAAGAVGEALTPGTTARIFTGAPVPPGADAVVMQEHCTVDGGHVLLNHLPRQGENIRRRGDDIASGATVLRQGTRLGAAQLGVAASVGAARLEVFRRLKVVLFSTGDELAMPGESLKPGGIYNSNRYTLNALLQALGCSVTDYGIVPDQLERTRAVLREAAQGHDLILTSGGVSVGEEDHVKQAVTAEGELALWKIAIKPGKPLAFGRVAKIAGPRSGNPGTQSAGAGGTATQAANAAFIGLPGNPVASFVTFLMLVRPYILKAQGAGYVVPQTLDLRADFNWPGDTRREFLRVRRNDKGGVDLFANQSSGVLTSCAWADGLVSNPPGQAIAVGDTVTFLTFAELN